MATYPNNYRTGVGFLPNYAFYGIMPYFQYNAEIGSGAGSRLNCHVADVPFPQTASIPDGYGMKTPFPPIKAGGISAWNDSVVSLSMTGSLLQGGPMEGSAQITFAESGDLSLVISMSASTAVATLTGNSMVLRLTVGVSGNGSFQLTGDGDNLALIVPFEGAGGVVTMGAGATDLKGRLALAGEWTPFTELSPEGLASAVWGALASQNNDSGTMGEKLNSAGSAANPWTEVIESGLSAAEVLRIISAALAGTSQKTGSTIVFKGLDGTTDRITGSFDVDGNRTGSIVDGS